MAVNLSPVGGVAAQFFDNNGNPLSGGKLYTYAAGTTTPATTYTSSSGSTAHTNPIVLDAGGRVPSGEIWLTDGLIYKFVLKTSTEVLIATYDNISGINSNFIAFTNQQQIVTATAGQTVFNLSIEYQPGTNSLSVFVDGVNQYGPGALYAYTETDSNTVTFNSGLHVGAEVKFTTSQQQGAGAVDASQVSYTPPFTGSVATNVEDKLAQTVSVKDFGAVGDGVTDDTAAIQDAIDADCTTLPLGNFVISSGLTTDKGLVGQVEKYSILEPSANSFDALTLNDTTADFQRVSDLTIVYPSVGTGNGVVLENLNNNVEVNRVNVQNANIGVNSKNTAFMQRFQQVRVDTANTGFRAQGFTPLGAGAGTTLIYDQCYCTNGVTTGWDLNNIRTVEMIQPTTDMAGMTTAIKCLGIGVLNIFGHHFEGTPGANGSYIQYTTSGNLAHGVNIIGGAIEIANLSALNYNYLNIQANDDTVRINLYGVNVRNLTGGANAYLAKLSGLAGSHIEIIAINCNFGALEGLFDTSTFSGTYSYRRIDQEVPVLAAGSASVAGGGVITTGVSGGTDDKIIFVQVRKDDATVPTVMAHVTQTYSGNSNVQIRYTKLSDGTEDFGTYTVNWQVLA
jgi:hypothetical protein